MSLDAEALVDRRRLRRKLSFWRVLGVLAVVAAVVSLGYAAGTRAGVGFGATHVARVAVTGFIGGSRSTTELLRRVADSGSVAGVVISINSPGGTTSGSEELYRSIRRVAEKKPVVAFVDGTAASGGYITALAADRIVARETSLVGSIGVIMQYPQVSELLSKLGVAVEEVKSAPLKAEPSGFRPTPPEAREALQRVVDDTHEWFKRLVATRRNLDDAALAAAADGRIFNGRQAMGLRLVDELGSEREAVAWLERERGVARDLPIRDWKPRGGSDFSLTAWAALGADLLGFERVAESLRRVGASIDAAQLDGLLAVWHPGLEK